MKKIFLLSFLFLISFLQGQTQNSNEAQEFTPTASQKHRCGTPKMSADTRRYIMNNIIAIEDQVAAQRNDAANCLPIKIHIVRNTDGSGGLALGDLAIAVTNLNYVYYQAGVEFFVCGDINYIDDSDFYDFDDGATDMDDETTFVSGEEVSTAINVFFMNTITLDNGGTPFSAAGYAYYPNNSAQANRIFMINSVATRAPNSTFSHELGHYFSLAHTHDNTEDGSADPLAERVVRTGGNANCATNGDMICDTDADPRYDNTIFNSSTCIYTGAEQDDLSVTYLPTSAINNIMSYYPDDCGGVFTPEQFTRIAAGLADRLTHTAYNYSCTAAAVTAASGLTATLNGNQIDLSWTDNASNELGYTIERSSTSSSTGFLPIIYGGVAPDVTTFSDTEDIANNTTYYYRVRPINSACDNYSAVASLTTGIIYCLPDYSSGCVNSVLEDFTLDGDGANDISNINSGCGGDGYANHTNLSADVTAASTYNFTSALNTGVCSGMFFTRYLEIWVDWNQDGDFDDLDEQMLNGTFQADPCYNSSFAVPATALNGSTVMRVILANSTSINDACGNYSFGETEDYTLNVSGGTLPVELTNFSGQTKSENVLLNWRTETEINNDFFILERSTDGIEFEPITKIEGAGTTQRFQEYSFLDEEALVGENYYRLQQTDFDGTSTFSKIIVVNVFSKKEIYVNVLPNPVEQNDFTLLYHAVESGKIQLEIVDLTGKIVAIKSLEVETGENNFSIEVEQISQGIYFLRTQQKSKVQTVRFVKL